MNLPDEIKVKGPAAVPLTRPAKAVIRRALREDLRGRVDITTRACVPSNRQGGAVIIAKAGGIIAGQALAAEVFRMAAGKGAARKGALVNYQAVIPDGATVDAGTVVARLGGVLWVILVGERTALNILGRCSGIATMTHAFVNAVAGTGARICETRKTAPGLRYLDKAAVRVGGGVNHRFGLYDAFLIKENHIAAAGGIRPAIEACRAFADRWGRFKIMVEARNLDEFRQAQAARPDRILLDNMSPEEIRACVKERVEGIALEATGGVNLTNVRAFAETGVDFISIGALTHSAPALDLSLLINGA